jgi:carboxyl-terminal processing protease
LIPDSIRGRPGFLSGLVVGLTLAALLALVSDRLDEGETDAVGQAREAIESSYFEEVDGDLLEQSSIDGMVRRLRARFDDRFSHYFAPDDLDAFEAATSGEFSGVGLTVSQVGRGLRVASVIPDTPAERAGIEVGDLIVAVEGRSLRGVPAEVSTGRIKGPPGTAVELELISEKSGRHRDVSLERARVRVPAVQGTIRHAGGNDVAYVRFASFTSGAHGDLRETIERLYRRGADALLLDLRGNGGGLLNEAVLSTSVFVEDGVIVSTDSRSRGHREYEAQGDALDPRPTVVLINRDTASAAEILTAALGDYDLATIVGTRSFGKGTFQEVIRLPGGGALDLTVGQYLTADGTSLAGKGIQPDVRAADDPDTPADEGLDRALTELARLGSSG